MFIDTSYNNAYTDNKVLQNFDLNESSYFIYENYGDLKILKLHLNDNKIQNITEMTIKNRIIEIEFDRYC